ncbi:hypothetical protein AMS59_13720 [Lysinibacillus sp. FJAT-14745]|uniref:hypothetical protein n=1 Tax=Lysinibacillus sp. FJAT-14745 TaxID=1704289 RepID=UPI0006ABDF73|nr:hypothetical protein [Lysinibacillus sp. FJAT-14745]KOP78151.1 hypothetical protein AMS59_13720 [Lysinibacillus sp. FJAT-14745]
MSNELGAKKKMLSLWATEKNKKVIGKCFNEITVKDKYSAFWKCDFNNPNCPLTVKSPEKVYQTMVRGGVVCQFCKGTNIEASVQTKAKNEHIEKYWHKERNSAMGYLPSIKAATSNDYIYVKCEEHHWGIYEVKKQKCADFTYGHIACPMCNGKQATPYNNLKVKYPDYAEKLHPAFDSELILPSTSDKYPFWCNLCGMYYLKEVRHKTSQNQGCPIHNSSHKFSRAERLLKLILNEIIGDFDKKYLDITWEKGHRIEIDLFECSLFIGIEFDGNHHKKRIQVRRDQTKNDLLYKHRETIGMALFIRIRERGLPELQYHENQELIICEKHRNSFIFLIPAIQQLITLINNRMQLNIKSYSDTELLFLIKKYLPLTSS